jgi:hypothetical protein
MSAFAVLGLSLVCAAGPASRPLAIRQDQLYARSIAADRLSWNNNNPRHDLPIMSIGISTKPMHLFLGSQIEGSKNQD